MTEKHEKINDNDEFLVTEIKYDVSFPIDIYI